MGGCVLPGGSPASRSHPHSPPERGHAGAARSSKGRLPPWSCGTTESNPDCLYSPDSHPGPAVSTHTYTQTQVHS